MASQVYRVLTKTLMRYSTKSQPNLLTTLENNRVLRTISSAFPCTRNLHTTTKYLDKDKTSSFPTSNTQNKEEEESKLNPGLNSSESIPQSISEEYSPFKDRQRVIQDVIEEQWNPILQEFEEVEVKVTYERGRTGVFDLDELVDVLKKERAQDICVIRIPKELDYADHMIVVTSRSPRHMFALATFVRKRFKSKHLKPSDILPRIEGTKDTKDWIALDLGNIILHIFEKEYRKMMDIETLWTVGAQYDDITNQKDPEIVQLLNLFQ